MSKDILGRMHHGHFLLLSNVSSWLYCYCSLICYGLLLHFRFTSYGQYMQTISFASTGNRTSRRVPEGQRGIKRYEARGVWYV